MLYGANASWGTGSDALTAIWQAQFAQNLAVGEARLKATNINWLRVNAIPSQSQRFTVAEQQFAAFPNTNWLAILDTEVNYTVIGKYPSVADWTEQDWLNYATAYVLGHPQVHMWDIFNEFYVTNYIATYPYFAANGWQGYANLCKDAYQMIKSTPGHQNDIVLAYGGIGLFRNTVQDITAYNANNPQGTLWFQGALIPSWSLLSNYCDGIDVHIYFRENTGDDTSRRYLLTDKTIAHGSTLASTYTVGQMAKMELDAIQAYTGKPIYIWETGCPMNTPSTSPTFQSQFANQIIPFLSGLPYIQGIAWWDMISAVGVVNGVDFGLWDYTTSPPTPRPALSAFNASSLKATSLNLAVTPM